MSPRFDRRPDKRMGGGGRGAGRPPRFSGPRPEWRREGAGEGRDGEGRGGDGRGADGRGGERREGSREGRREFGAPPSRGASRYQPRREGGLDRSGSRGERRSDSDRSYGDGKPFDRRPGRRPDGVRPEGRRVEGRRFEAGRFDAGRRLPAGRFGGGRSEVGRPQGGRFESGRFESGRFESGRPGAGGRFAPKPLIVDADSLAPSGDAERHSVDPSSDLIWGRHPAQAALESGRPIHRIWCTPEMRFSPKFLQLLREAKASGVLVEEVTWARLGQLTGGAVHQGITLQTAAAETLDLPTLIEGCAAIGEPPLLMAVDGLTDPQNLGAIVRSAEALGAHGLVLPQRRSAGLTGSVAKVAAGALEHLPVARVVNLNRALDSLKQEGYRVVGLAAEGTVSLEEADLEGPLVIVTGSEGDGLSMLTRRNCDQLVRIPLRGATPSLNASVATALLLYEVARRGWMKGLRGSQPAPRLVRPQLPAPAAEPAPEPTPEASGAVEAEVAPPLAPAMEAAAAPIPETPGAAPGDVAAPETVAVLETEAAPAEDSPAELTATTDPATSEAATTEAATTDAAALELGLTPARPDGFWGDIQL